jgi:hypothetical protein
MQAEPSAELRIRGHHLLCMLGFRGLGYSAGFVANMQAVVDAFLSDPPPAVEVVIEADSICRACPHLSEGACARKESSEERVRSKDSAVLGVLGIAAGSRMTASELRARVAGRVSVSTLESLCARCGWWGHGYCAEGLRQLRREHRGG